MGASEEIAEETQEANLETVSPPLRQGLQEADLETAVPVVRLAIQRHAI